MANVFGTPVYLYSAEDPANRESQSGGQSGTKQSVTTQLKDVLKNLQPLEKAVSALANAEKCLDGTGYDDLRQAIQGVSQQIDAKITEMVPQFGGQQAQPQQQNQSSASVPTAGQISGAEPLPGDKA